MRITLLAVGKIRNTPEAALVDTYVSLLPWPTNIVEVEERRPIKGPERQSREGQLLLKAIPKGAFVIALDERGKSLRSEAFADKIRQWQDMGYEQLVFMIGGADGFSQEIRERADLHISLSQMTWPHMMVRAMLAEQLYRASTIISGHPYHKD